LDPRNVYVNLHLRDNLVVDFICLLKRTDTRGGADVINTVRLMSNLRGLRPANDVTIVTHKIFNLNSILSRPYFRKILISLYAVLLFC